MYMDTENGPGSQAHRGRGRGSYQRGGFGRGNSAGGGNWNQSQGRGGGSGFNQNYSGQQYRGSSRGRAYSGTWGNRGRGPPRGGRSRGGRAGGRSIIFDDPEDIEFLRALKGHTKQINALAVDPASQQIYSGSKDGTVRVWNCQTFQCERTVPIGEGCEIDSLLLVPGYLIVGFHTASGEGVLKVWNMATAADHTLVGHQGQVLCLAAAMDFLFSGGQDTSIRVWKFNTATSTFDAAAAMTMAQGGHSGAVQCLVPIGQFLFSADWNGDIKVLNLESGAFVQSISRAHTGVIMNLLSWENHLLSCSLDGSIKVWKAVDNPAPGAVLDQAPIYSHPPADNGHEGFGAVLAMAGMQDGLQRSVLAASHNDENIARLWELPTFAERGHLNQIRDARAMTAGPDGLIISGDAIGVIKVWRWRS